MTARTRTLIGLLVLAPLLAVVLIATLLLLGVEPHLVFLPGHVLRSLVRVPNRVGVLATVVVWWAVIVTLWLALRRLARR